MFYFENHVWICFIFGQKRNFSPDSKIQPKNVIFVHQTFSFLDHMTDRKQPDWTDVSIQYQLIIIKYNF